MKTSTTLIALGLGAVGLAMLAKKPSDEVAAEDGSGSYELAGGGGSMPYTSDGYPTLGDGPDLNGNGIPDAYEAPNAVDASALVDSDKDGVPDSYDYYPMDPTRSAGPGEQATADYYNALDTSTPKPGFFDTGLGQTVGYAATAAVTTLPFLLMNRKPAGVPAGGAVPRVPRAPRAPGAVSRFMQFKPLNAPVRTAAGRFAPAGRLAVAGRVAGRSAAFATVATGAYTAGRNLWDTGAAVKNAVQGDREQALKQSSRAVQRGTQFLTLGALNVNLHKKRVKVFGRKVYG